MVEGNGWSRTAILNRPSALNALNTSMVCSSVPPSLLSSSFAHFSFYLLLLFLVLVLVWFSQVAKLTKLYRSWEDNTDVGFVVIKVNTSI